MTVSAAGRSVVGMTFVVVRVVAPAEERVGEYADEGSALRVVRDLEADAPAVDVYDEVRDAEGRPVWTTESGVLERA